MRTTPLTFVILTFSEKPAHIEVGQAMIENVLNVLFGCRHRQLTRPITPVHKPGTRAGDTYVACLECGRRFQYDAKELRLGAPLPAAQASYSPLASPFQVQ